MYNICKSLVRPRVVVFIEPYLFVGEGINIIVVIKLLHLVVIHLVAIVPLEVLVILAHYLLLLNFVKMVQGFQLSYLLLELLDL